MILHLNPMSFQGYGMVLPEPKNENTAADAQPAG